MRRTLASGLIRRMAVRGVFKSFLKWTRYENFQALTTNLSGTNHHTRGFWVSRSQVKAETCAAVANDDAISRPQIGAERYLRRSTHL